MPLKGRPIVKLSPCVATISSVTTTGTSPGPGRCRPVQRLIGTRPASVDGQRRSAGWRPQSDPSPIDSGNGPHRKPPPAIRSPAFATLCPMTAVPACGQPERNRVSCCTTSIGIGSFVLPWPQVGVANSGPRRSTTQPQTTGPQTTGVDRSPAPTGVSLRRPRSGCRQPVVPRTDR